MQVEEARTLQVFPAVTTRRAAVEVRPRPERTGHSWNRVGRRDATQSVLGFRLSQRKLLKTPKDAALQAAVLAPARLPPRQTELLITHHCVREHATTDCFRKGRQTGESEIVLHLNPSLFSLARFERRDDKMNEASDMTEHMFMALKMMSEFKRVFKGSCGHKSSRLLRAVLEANLVLL